MLRRRLSLAQPLTSRVPGLRARLAAHPPVADGGEESLIWAAVAVLLVPSPDAVLLIRRADRDGDPWSGHMALPGGRRGPTDRDLLDTAVRETLEEVGASLARSELLGRLDDVVPRTPVLPPIAVRPFVFALPERPPLAANPEVAAVRWVPLDELLRPGVYGSAHLDIRGAPREVAAYRLHGALVWGLTERILTNLLDHLHP
ncbi:MAG: CoA pyrophosphatase [Gemmatimonadales bacterium]